MTTGVRYTWQGSHIQIQTALGSGDPITAVSKASPAHVTATNAFAVGDVVKFTDIPGMTQLEGVLGIVENPSGTAFDAANIDSTNFTTFAASTAHSPVAAKVTFSDFCELTGFNQQDGQAPQIDATTLCSTAQEFEIGLRDTGTISMDFNFAPNTATQAAIRASQAASSLLAFKVILPKNGGTIIMTGFVQQASFNASNGNLWKASASIKLTGDIFVLAGD